MANMQTSTPNPQATFEQLWAILGELKQTLENRFPLHPRPEEQPLESFHSPDQQIEGSLRTFASSDIEWLVHSWLRNPQVGFSTMRLSIWLRSHIQTPHLVFEFGTTPTVFFYMDYIPRVDLWTNLDYVERYYEPTQEAYLRLRNDPDLILFVSKALYVRQVQSPINLCYTCAARERSFDLIRSTAHEMLERWIGWVETAKPVPEAKQTALAQRDLLMRRISAERDPGNAVVAKILGAELTENLVRSLWGGWAR